MEASESHKPFFSQEVLKRATKLTWFEKVALKFIKPTYVKDDFECTVTVFKTFRGKLYLINQYSIPPQGFNCRCTIQPKL